MKQPVVTALSHRVARRVAIALIAFAGVAPAMAQNGAARVPLRQACQEDYQRLCSGVSRGGGRLRQCMLDHAEQLTPKCQDALKAREMHRTSANNAR